MTFPKQAQAALAQTNLSVLPGVLAVDERECVGATFHSPNPLVLNEVEVDGEVVLLCGTCLANLRVLQHLIENTDGDLPWVVRRDFGNKIRALAFKGKDVTGD